MSKSIMHKSAIPSAVFEVALSTCVVEPELLNSERIQERFGSFGIDLLDHDHGVRRCNLYSLENGRKTCRTYAVVLYTDVNNVSINQEHAQILSGASIGATFKTGGWSIYKETRCIDELELPQESAHIRQLMGPPESSAVTMHVYRLLLKKDQYIIDYATIIEIHHPDYLRREEIAYLYLVDEPAPLSASELQTLTALVLAGPGDAGKTAFARD